MKTSSNARPTKNRKDINWLSSIASLFTIFGVILGIPAIYLSYYQLQQLASQAEINIKFMPVRNTSIESGRSNPLEIFVSANNSVNSNTSYWRVATVFCKKTIEVTSHPSNWIRGDSWQYYYESRETPLPTLPLQVPLLEKIGSFKLNVLIDENTEVPKFIPVALVIVSGERTITKTELISASSGGFINVEVRANDGKLSPDLSNCIDEAEKKTLF